MNEFLAHAVQVFQAHEAELNALDAAIGDGDHGATMLKGLTAAQTAEAAPERAFRRAAGGASGALFAELIKAFGQLDNGTAVGIALGEAAERIARIGQALPGDKTMLDASLPAAKAGDLRGAADAADAGVLATKAMAARRGRAKHVEGAGMGHVDAGASSVALLLTAYADWSDI